MYSAQIDPSDPRTVPNSEWEKRLTPEQYSTTREKFTEPVCLSNTASDMISKLFSLFSTINSFF